jgi:type II secretory pathway component GspD/PulD (secretin)
LYFGTDGTASAVGAAPVVLGGEGAQINFENADIRDFLKAVLADTLKASYSIDPKVQGTATVSSNSVLSRQDLLATVETVLRMNGAALIVDGANYRIVPASEAAGGRVMVQLGSDQSLCRRAMASQIHPNCDHRPYGGQNWTPIPNPTGSNLHAETQSGRAAGSLGR